jgi:hypothetical protein
MLPAHAVWFVRSVPITGNGLIVTVPLPLLAQPVVPSVTVTV